jgi:hypothetical protein
MSALLVIWFGLPILAFIAPWLLDMAKAMSDAYRMVKDAASAVYGAAMPMVHIAVARCIVARYRLEQRFSATLDELSARLDPNYMIRLAYLQLCN